MGSTADPSSRFTRSKRRNYLRDGADVHVHAGAGSAPSLSLNRRDHAQHWHEQHAGLSGAASAAPSPAAGHVTPVPTPTRLPRRLRQEVLYGLRQK